MPGRQHSWAIIRSAEPPAPVKGRKMEGRREGFITLLYTSTPSSGIIITDWIDNVYEVNVTGFVNIELRRN